MKRSKSLVETDSLSHSRKYNLSLYQQKEQGYSKAIKLKTQYTIEFFTTGKKKERGE